MPSSIHPSTSSMRRATAVLLALLLAAHAPMLLNDGLFMDDWLVLKAGPGFVIDIDFLLHGAGHPVFYSYDAIANWTGAPIAVMLSLALAGIVFGATSLALAATRLDLLDRAEAVGFALMVWTYPGYQLWAGKANAVYVLSFGLLFVGTLLLTLAYGARGVRCALLRLACALAFLLGFALNSTIVLYAFVVLGLFVAIWLRGEPTHGLVRRTWLAGWCCAGRYPDLVMLPLIYWGALNIWFKRSGVYAQYYNAHFPRPGELLNGWETFFLAGYSDVALHAIEAADAVPKLFIAAALLVGIALFLLRADMKATAPRYASLLPFALAVVVFLVLSLPYLIAGISPSSTNFYESRHLLMFGLPLALTLLAIKRGAERWIGPSAAIVLVFGSGAVLSIGLLWTDYAFMQARTLKQQALAHHLAHQPQPAATVFALDDGFVDYPSRHTSFGFTEVTGTLRLVWGNQPFLGFALRAERPTVLREVQAARTGPNSAFAHLDPSGPQATISMQPGPAAAPNLALARKYYTCRLLARCDVSQLLDQLAQVSIKVGPIAGILPLEATKPIR
ncbi:hypothetical protein EAS56_26290 [Bradyrhizobium guangzhouense]|uniref:Uncharacterized protein n=2 Tax=Bradyrhizobium guangzhouense TaxID=1325095 RepID=A0AAE5X0G0_9BRAD|nr:hypothetical protein XH91_14350 [Bradyrhizobium guangzhouense]RXH09480.1 hypothetical protein EAS56_26290 [Bradyrhizobium guangzhouense]